MYKNSEEELKKRLKFGFSVLNPLKYVSEQSRD